MVSTTQPINLDDGQPLPTTLIKIMREGRGAIPKKGDHLTIHYKSVGGLEKCFLIASFVYQFSMIVCADNDTILHARNNPHQRIQGQTHDFDDTWLIKKPYTFKVGVRKVIDGWDIAFLSGQIREGTLCELIVPYTEACKSLMIWKLNLLDY